jgi:uncharacterized OsmC-like protein
VTGDVETEGGVLVLRRIHAHFRLRARRLSNVQLAAVERAHAHHLGRCPVARSLRGAIEITTSYEIGRAEG